MIVIVMGVMGAGKTTVGSEAAARLGWRFIDADDFHPAENRARLERGEPLDDVDRAPWLRALRDALEASVAAGDSVVLACSALKQSYREALVPRNAVPGTVLFAWLYAGRELLQLRLAARTDSRASPALLPSQLATLEPPADALRLDARCTPSELADEIVRAVRRSLAATRSSTTN